MTSIKEKLSNYEDSTSLSYNFRHKRFAFFMGLLRQLPKPINILDIGGTQTFWDSMGFREEGVNITLLNLRHVKVDRPGFVSAKGDATKMSEYANQSFDIVFSNSVIEHLFTKENQLKMASEARRVGKNYFIQTPNYYFPVEPHWLFPGFQYLPVSMRVFLTSNFQLGHIPKLPNKAEAEQMVREVRLLTEDEMRELFPDGQIYREKIGPLTKSLVAWRF